MTQSIHFLSTVGVIRILRLFLVSVRVLRRQLSLLIDWLLLIVILLRRKIGTWRFQVDIRDGLILIARLLGRRLRLIRRWGVRVRYRLSRLIRPGMRSGSGSRWSLLALALPTSLS